MKSSLDVAEETIDKYLYYLFLLNCIIKVLIFERYFDIASMV